MRQKQRYLFFNEMSMVTVRTMQYRRYKLHPKYKEWKKHNYNSQKHKRC